MGKMVVAIAKGLLAMITSSLLVVDCAAALLATAVSKWLPFESVVVSRKKLKRGPVTATPAFLPSTANCTLVVFEETIAVTLMVPKTIAPVAGAVIQIVGGVGVTVAEKPVVGLGGVTPRTCALKSVGGFGGTPGGKNSVMLGAVAAPPKPLKFSPNSSAVRRSELSCE